MLSVTTPMISGSSLWRTPIQLPVFPSVQVEKQIAGLQSLFAKRLHEVYPLTPHSSEPYEWGDLFEKGSEEEVAALQQAQTVEQILSVALWMGFEIGLRKHLHFVNQDILPLANEIHSFFADDPEYQNYKEQIKQYQIRASRKLSKDFEMCGWSRYLKNPNAVDVFNRVVSAMEHYYTGWGGQDVLPVYWLDYVQHIPGFAEWRCLVDEKPLGERAVLGLNYYESVVLACVQAGMWVGIAWISENQEFLPGLRRFMLKMR